MAGEIFGKYAPLYWAKGLPVIPLYPQDKRPCINMWSRFAEMLPAKEDQDRWVADWPRHNMGLPLGKQSGLVMIDYDYDNPIVEEAMLSVLPPSPWKRIGNRGYVLAYRYKNTPNKKIYDENGKMVVEILSTGAQVVLPPSIHPKTMLPYFVDGDVNLLDVLDKLHECPEDIEERLRTALSTVMKLKDKNSQGSRIKFTDFVPDGARDVEMTRRAGFLSFSIQRGELSVKEALAHLNVWHENFVQKKIADPLDINKGYAKIVEFLIADVGRGRMLPPGWDKELSEAEKESWGLNFDEDSEEWTFDQIIKYIEAVQNNSAPDSAEMIQCQTRVCTKLARSNNLNTLEEERILQKLKGTAKGGVAPFKAMIKKMQKTKGIEGKSHAEIANEVVKDFQEYQGGPMAYHEGQFWNWTGSNWETLPEHILRAFVANRFGEFDIAKKYNDYKQVVSCIKDLAPQRIKADVTVDGINFNNGFLNKNRVMVPHSPEQGMTYTLPFGYHPDRAGKSPKFFQYLKDSWGEDADAREKMIALQEAICVTLFGVATSYQRCFLLWGVPGTGKSVMMKIIMEMVPKNAYSAINPYQWDLNKNKFMVAQFSGKLLNVAGELDDKKKINSQIFKQIITGEEITGEHKNRDPFKFCPRAAHWFASNYLPQTDDATNAFTRRWLIFQFKNVVPQSKKVLDLENEIVFEEMDAIVAWALTAWPELQKRNEYTLPDSCKRTLHQMALANSNIRGFVEDNIIFTPGSKTQFDDAYNAYWGYSTKRFLPVKKPQEFTMEFNMILNEMGYDKFQFSGSKTTYFDMALLKGEK